MADFWVFELTYERKPWSRQVDNRQGDTELALRIRALAS